MQNLQKIYEINDTCQLINTNNSLELVELCNLSKEFQNTFTNLCFEIVNEGIKRNGNATDSETKVQNDLFQLELKRLSDEQSRLKIKYETNEQFLKEKRELELKIWQTKLQSNKKKDLNNLNKVDFQSENFEFDEIGRQTKKRRFDDSGIIHVICIGSIKSKGTNSLAFIAKCNCQSHTCDSKISQEHTHLIIDRRNSNEDINSVFQRMGVVLVESTEIEDKKQFNSVITELRKKCLNETFEKYRTEPFS